MTRSEAVTLVEVVMFRSFPAQKLTSSILTTRHSPPSPRAHRIWEIDKTIGGALHHSHSPLSVAMNGYCACRVGAAYCVRLSSEVVVRH